MENKISEYKVYNDKWGKLVALEGEGTVPFKINRVYYIYEVDEGVRRGFHAHKELEQILICVHGKVKILVKTPEEEETIVLDNPNKGLYVGPSTWREMYDFEDGAVLLVLASEHYTESDYIRNYDDYVKFYNEMKEGKK